MNQRMYLITGGIGGIVLIALGIFISNFLSQHPDGEAFQRDADILRLNDLKTLGSYIETYRQKTGKYPLEGLSDQPNYVHFTSEDQKQYVEGGPSVPHVKTSQEQFQQEIERVLEHSIELPFDPQKRPLYRPNAYVYIIEGNHYRLRVHLHRFYPFAYKVKKYFYQVEMSNHSDQPNGTWLYTELMQHPVFQEVISKPLSTPEYFRKLRKINE